MARKKTITREQILVAAHQVISDKGFSHFTARNIATQMNCSTQPIYLEFKNMDDLKEALFHLMAEKTSEDFLNSATQAPYLPKLGLSFIMFAKNNRQLYQSLYLEEELGAKTMQLAFQECFNTLLAKEENAETLSEDSKKEKFMIFWIYVSGMASMVSQHILTYSNVELETMLKAFLKSTKKDKSEMQSLFTLGNLFRN